VLVPATAAVNILYDNSLSFDCVVYSKLAVVVDSGGTVGMMKTEIVEKEGEIEK